VLRPDPASSRTLGWETFRFPLAHPLAETALLRDFAPPAPTTLLLGHEFHGVAGRQGRVGRMCDPISVTDPAPTEPVPLDSVPLDSVPLDSGGLDPDSVRELAAIPAVEVITRAAVMLMSAAAEKLGLASDGELYLDLDEARRLIEAYAGLLAAAQADLGVHRQPLRDGLKSLQAAFAEASRYPDASGQGPGEKYAL
jgi:hypothetical protein